MMRRVDDILFIFIGIIDASLLVDFSRRVNDILFIFICIIDASLLVDLLTCCLIDLLTYRNHLIHSDVVVFGWDAIDELEVEAYTYSCDI